jgi:hypothetical protein
MPRSLHCAPAVQGASRGFAMRQATPLTAGKTLSMGACHEILVSLLRLRFANQGHSPAADRSQQRLTVPSSLLLNSLPAPAHRPRLARRAPRARPPVQKYCVRLGHHPPFVTDNPTASDHQHARNMIRCECPHGHRAVSAGVQTESGHHSDTNNHAGASTLQCCSPTIKRVSVVSWTPLDTGLFSGLALGITRDAHLRSPPCCWRTAWRWGSRPWRRQRPCQTLPWWRPGRLRWW